MVKITASIAHTEEVLSIDIDNTLSLQDFKAYLSAETNIEPGNQIIIFNSDTLIGDDKTLKDLGINDDELIIVQDKSLLSTSGPSQSNGTSTASSSNLENDQIEQLRQQILNNPFVRQQVTSSNPEIENVLNDSVQFRQLMLQIQQHQQSNLPGGVSQQEWSKLQSDPDNPNNQKRIMELIEQDQIEENMRNALEFSPESFASVTMLYINVEVNGHPVKAFVDSGAQVTIISTKLAKECDISRLIDKRFKGQAHGVGQSEIIGRIHSVPLKIENTFAPCSFTVLDTHVDLLLGLDMLKRHQANIDLKRNVLSIADVETPFLGEAEIPKNSPFYNDNKTPSGVGNILGGSSSQEPLSAGSSASQPASVAAAKAAASRNNASSQPAQSAQSSQSQTFNEDTVRNLINLGFSREQVIRALKQANGNAEFAAAFLFQ